MIHVPPLEMQLQIPQLSHQYAHKHPTLSLPSLSLYPNLEPKSVHLLTKGIGQCEGKSPETYQDQVLCVCQLTEAAGRRDVGVLGLRVFK
jgi:hypothetical protein